MKDFNLTDKVADEMAEFDVPWANPNRRPRTLSQEENDDLTNQQYLERRLSEEYGDFDPEEDEDATDAASAFTADDFRNMQEWDVPWADSARRPRSISKDNYEDFRRQSLFRAEEEEDEDEDDWVKLDHEGNVVRSNKQDRAEIDDNIDYKYEKFLLERTKEELRSGTDTFVDYEDARDIEEVFTAADFDRMQEWDVPWADGGRRPRSISIEDEEDFRCMEDLERRYSEENGDYDVDEEEDINDALQGFTYEDYKRFQEWDVPWTTKNCVRPRTLSEEDYFDLEQQNTLCPEEEEIDEIELYPDQEFTKTDYENMSEFVSGNSSGDRRDIFRTRSLSVAEEEDLLFQDAIDYPRKRMNSLSPDNRKCRGKLLLPGMKGALLFRSFLR
eukprot:g4472.t1